MKLPTDAEATELQRVTRRPTAGRPPKSHDNAAVCQYLAGFDSCFELAEHHPEADDIFCGVLGLRTGGVTSTRTLSRRSLFRILRQCPTITTDAVAAALGHSRARRTCEAYAAMARVASTALAALFRGLPVDHSRITPGEARRQIDAPYAEELAAILPACKVWSSGGGEEKIDGAELWARVKRRHFDRDQRHA